MSQNFNKNSGFYQDKDGNTFYNSQPQQSNDDGNLDRVNRSLFFNANPPNSQNIPLINNAKSNQISKNLVGQAPGNDIQEIQKNNPTFNQKTSKNLNSKNDVILTPKNIVNDKNILYKILNLDNNATQQQIKTSIKKMLFKYHPDKNRGISEKQMQINSDIMNVIKYIQNILLSDKKQTYNSQGLQNLNAKRGVKNVTSQQMVDAYKYLIGDNLKEQQNNLNLKTSKNSLQETPKSQYLKNNASQQTVQQIQNKTLKNNNNISNQISTNIAQQTDSPPALTSDSQAIEIQSGTGLGQTQPQSGPNTNKIRFLKQTGTDQTPTQYADDPSAPTQKQQDFSQLQQQQLQQEQLQQQQEQKQNNVFSKKYLGRSGQIPPQYRVSKDSIQQSSNTKPQNSSKQQPNFKQKILNQFQTLNNKQVIDVILVYVIKVFSLIFFYVSQYYVYQLFVSRIVKAKASADPLPDLSIYIRYSIVALTILQIIPLIIILTMVSRDKYLSSNGQATIIKIIGDVFLTNFILYFFGRTFVQIILSKSNNNYQDQPSYAIQELSSLLKSCFLYIVFLPYFSVFYLLNSLSNQQTILSSSTPN